MNGKRRPAFTLVDWKKGATMRDQGTTHAYTYLAMPFRSWLHLTFMGGKSAAILLEPSRWPMISDEPAGWQFTGNLVDPPPDAAPHSGCLNVAYGDGHAKFFRLNVANGNNYGFDHFGWEVVVMPGTGVGQASFLQALAVDAAGNLYVASSGSLDQQLQRRDAQGDWSVLDISESDLLNPSALAVDAAGNLYLAGLFNGGVEERDVQGHWSVVAAAGTGIGQVNDDWLVALAVDGAGNLYVADSTSCDCGDARIQKRDVLGNWSVIPDPGFGGNYYAFAADPMGNLYAASDFEGIQERDTQGSWSVIAGEYLTVSGEALMPVALAVDAAGNLYVADAGNNRVLEYTAAPGP